MRCPAPSPKARGRRTSGSPGPATLFTAPRSLPARWAIRVETINDLLVFHIVFGKTVNDVSLNAVANLGYAGLRFLVPVYPGDTLRSVSEVVGKKENSNGKTGVVWVKTVGTNQRGETVLEYYRWVMVNKRDPSTPTGAADRPAMPKEVAPADLIVPSNLDLGRYEGLAVGWQRLLRGPTSPARRSITSTA